MSVKMEIRKAKFDETVRRFEAMNAEKGQIVFYGPSNFTRWNGNYNECNLEEDIRGASGKKCCLNRGFGGSGAEHHLYYYDRIVRPLEPKVLVYAGYGNSPDYTDEEMWFLAQRVIAWAKADFPDIHIYLCGPKINVNSTEAEMDRRRTVNGWMKTFASEHENMGYIDTINYEPFLNKELLPTLFVEDRVHFNGKGYKLYEALFREALKDELAKY